MPAMRAIPAIKLNDGAFMAPFALFVKLHMPLARQANSGAINVKGMGLPAGPYDSLFGKDSADY
jgi:hypothetical protein